jgi:hypothetical protein
MSKIIKRIIDYKDKILHILPLEYKKIINSGGNEYIMRVPSDVFENINELSNAVNLIAKVAFSHNVNKRYILIDYSKKIEKHVFALQDFLIQFGYEIYLRCIEEKDLENEVFEIVFDCVDRRMPDFGAINGLARSTFPASVLYLDKEIAFLNENTKISYEYLLKVIESFKKNNLKISELNAHVGDLESGCGGASFLKNTKYEIKDLKMLIAILKRIIKENSVFKKDCKIIINVISKCKINKFDLANEDDKAQVFAIQNLVF